MLLLLLLSFLQSAFATSCGFCALPKVAESKVLKLNCEWNVSGSVIGVHLICEDSCLQERFQKDFVKPSDKIIVEAHLRNATCLYFYDNLKIKVVPADALQNLPNLEKLSMAYMKIENVSSAAFRTNKHLKQLDLKSNSLSVIETMFNNLKNLETLNLQGNQLKQIGNKDFRDLSNLTRLFLQENQISDIKERSFSELLKLKILELNSNKLFSIPQNLFRNLNLLQSLTLSHNLFQNLETGVFEGLKSVNRIDLSYNKLTTIEENVFRDTPNLKQLRLHGNPLLIFDEKWLLQINPGSFVEISSKDFYCAEKNPKHPLTILSNRNITLQPINSGQLVESTPCQYHPKKRKRN